MGENDKLSIVTNNVPKNINKFDINDCLFYINKNEKNIPNEEQEIDLGDFSRKNNIKNFKNDQKENNKEL